MEDPTPILLHGDCLEKMNELQPGSVDCVINDPPYGCTSNDWDRELHLEKMWECYLRVLKPNGTVILFCCSDTTDDPLLPRLMMSRPKGWKFYTLVFQKANHSNPMLKDVRPLRVHEDILVFYRGTHTYNPQMWEKTHRYQGNIKNQGMKEKALRCPISILPVFPREMNSANATAKPVGTMEWLVKTYSNEYDTVLDNTMGSGTTGVACANTYRSFVGIELSDQMYAFAEDRVKRAYAKTLREGFEKEEGVDPVSITLPERLNQFDTKDYMDFYEKVSQLRDYDAVLSWLVKYLNQYFAIINGDSYEIMECVYGSYSPLESNVISDTPVMESEREKIMRPVQYLTRKPAEVKLRLRKCALYNENGKNVDLYDAWSKSLEAQEYTSKVFDPTEQSMDEGVLNTFTGLKANLEIVGDHMNTSMTTVPQEDFQIILDQVMNLVGGNKMYYEYLLDWLAYPIQTGRKTNVAVIAQGGQGCGKTMFFTNFIGQMIYGDTYFAKIAGGAQIGGDFNAHIVGKMYLAIEEPNQFSKAKLNLLKDLITSDVTEVNAKGKNQYFVDDYTNYVFTCNYIPEQMLEEDDRRYFIIQHNGEKVDYEDLAFAMETYYLDFYKFLKMRDIKKFVYGQAPPQTGIKERLMAQNLDPIFKYLGHLAETDALDNFYKRPSDQTPVLPFKAFFKNAVAWCDLECESATWKRSPVDLKRIIKSKLEDDYFNIDGVPVKLPNYADGGMKAERCVLFPKDSEALMELLVKKKVYVNYQETTADEYESCVEESQEEIDDYETLLAEEARKAEIIELNKMKKKMKSLDEQLEDLVFDKEWCRITILFSTLALLISFVFCDKSTNKTIHFFLAFFAKTIV